MTKRKKAVILSGGTGSRLFPSTISTSKQLLPVFDKPMIFYPISFSIMSNIRDVLIITNREYLDNYKRLFGKGDNLGMDIKYKIQERPNGIAESLIIAEDFLEGEDFALFLGDNIFCGTNIQKKLESSSLNKNATIFVSQVKNPHFYGVVEFDKEFKPLRIIEKPKNYVSDLAVTGVYFYDQRAIEIAKSLKPSPRGELEISDINDSYLKEGKLNITFLDPEEAWFDAGNHEDLLEASQYIYSLEKRTGNKFYSPEELAFLKGWITKDRIKEASNKMSNSIYGQYLKKLT